MSTPQLSTCLHCGRDSQICFTQVVVTEEEKQGQTSAGLGLELVDSKVNTLISRPAGSMQDQLTRTMAGIQTGLYPEILNHICLCFFKRVNREDLVSIIYFTIVLNIRKNYCLSPNLSLCVKGRQACQVCRTIVVWTLMFY